LAEDTAGTTLQLERYEVTSQKTKQKKRIRGLFGGKSYK
jgi:hypothetical protein